MDHLQTVAVNQCSDICSQEYDCVVIILEDSNSLSESFTPISSSVKDYSKIISSNTGVHTVYCDKLQAGRLVLSFTGPIDRDYDDIRRITEASKEGILQAIKLGSTKPLLALANLTSLKKVDADWTKPNALCLSALLSALGALYVPLEVREFSEQSKSKPSKEVKSRKAEYLGWLNTPDYAVHKDLSHIAWCIEEGRRVSRDIGGSDPERMCATRIVDYLREELKGSGIEMKVGPVDPVEYPLAAVVDRGSNERHRGRIVHLEYSGSDATSRDSADVMNLFLVGKGIVYDTGGSDLKVGGSMATMHRDKCGAAAVSGFFKVLSLLKPGKLNVHGSLAIVRNSIGDNAYVSDEIITSKAGVRVRVTNTDAEGRMVMTDLLHEAKQEALKVTNPHLVTVATLTGHVVFSIGPSYTGIMCNGLARKMKADFQFQSAGSLLGEMSEVSTIRREDFEAHNALEEYCELQNSARPIDGKRSRGHQSPAAFMIVASGLDEHMCNSEHPLPYTHFDIAGSQGPCPGIPSAVPILTWSSQFLLQHLWQ